MLMLRKTVKEYFLPSTDAGKIAQFTDNFVFMQFIELPEELVAAAGSQRPNIYLYNKDLLKLQFTKNSYNTVCLTDLSNYRFIDGNSPLYNWEFGFDSNEKQTLPLARENSGSYNLC